MMVRVQKSKEDGLDFSLALSFYLLFLRWKRYPVGGTGDFSGPLSLPLSDFGSFGGVGSDGLSSLFLSRREKKKKKLSLLAVLWADVDCTR